MDKSRLLWRSSVRVQQSKKAISTIPPTRPQTPWTCTQCLSKQRQTIKSNHPFRRPQRRHQTSPADEPGFSSIVDNPPTLVRTRRRHNKLGLAILAAIPITSFILGCWQVQRLGWKSELIAKFEDRLVREPLPLPPQVDPAAIRDFDYRRVYARGRWRHDQEMLIGPRLHDGEDGYLVVTPLDRSDDFPAPSSSAAAADHTQKKPTATILVNRGWIPKSKAAQASRPDGLPTGVVVAAGLLREPWKKNMFTPDNAPAAGQWYFPDVRQMAEHTGAQPVWIEETMVPDLLTAYDRQARGIPIGRPAEVNLRNNHTQYIFTWFSLCAATSVMMWMVVRKPAKGVGRGVRQNRTW